jgi:hypothetical protein
MDFIVLLNETRKSNDQSDKDFADEILKELKIRQLR